MASFRRTILARGGSEEELNKLSAAELVHINPLLQNYTPTTRLAYAKFKSFVTKDLKKPSDVKDKFGEENETGSKRITPTMSRLSSFVDKKTSSLAGSLSGSISNLAIKEENEEKSPMKESTQNNNPPELPPVSPAPPTPSQVAAVLDKKLIEFSPEGSGVQPVPEQTQNGLKSPKIENQENQKMDAPKTPENGLKSPKIENQEIQRIEESKTPEKQSIEGSNLQPEKPSSGLKSPNKRRGGKSPKKSPKKKCIESPTKEPSEPEMPKNNSVKLLTRQFSQDQSNPMEDGQTPKPIMTKGPKAKIVSEFKPKPLDESPKNKPSPPPAGARKKNKKSPSPPTKPKSHPSPAKVFPEAENRSHLGIQSPLSSPVLEAKTGPPSPLPPKNVPLSMDTLIPFVDENNSPTEKITVEVPLKSTPEKPKIVKHEPKIEETEPEKTQKFEPKIQTPDEGKSVITGQVRSGWL